MTMTVEILNVIHAVLDYKQFICSQNKLKQFHTENFDWFAETKKYYYNLDLPDGMHHNNANFEKILAYQNTKELDELDHTEESELSNFKW